MSGGRWDNIEINFPDIADDLEKESTNNNGYSDDTKVFMMETALMMREMYSRIKCLDYLMEGDDGEESFRERYNEYVAKQPPVRNRRVEQLEKGIATWIEEMRYFTDLQYGKGRMRKLLSGKDYEDNK